MFSVDSTFSGFSWIWWFQARLWSWFGDLWRSQDSILMISEGIGKSLEFHRILWSDQPQNPGIMSRGVKVWFPGTTSNQPDCCRMQYCKISRYQIASFEGYSISKMIDTRFEDCKGFEDYIPQAWKGFEELNIRRLITIRSAAWWPTRGRRILKMSKVKFLKSCKIRIFKISGFAKGRKSPG